MGQRSRSARQGIVYLVGAGPGDPELLTVRGLRCLRRADVVVYDRLVAPELLDEAPAWAQRIFVGKAPAKHAFSQEDINRLLVEQAAAGAVVVRLKGGDPFVFGRGGEEAAACAAAGIRWEVVPGISSALAVPASAGIPVTHRQVSGAFAVVTAHRAADDPAAEDRWRSLAGIDTLVVLMGVRRLPEVVDTLRRHGRSAETPAAVIERGTRREERILVGTLADIVERCRLANVSSPATIIIGEVVHLRTRLAALGHWIPRHLSSDGEGHDATRRAAGGP